MWFRHNLYWWCLFFGLFRLWLDLLYDVFALRRIVGLLLVFIGLFMPMVTPVFSIATMLIILLLIAVKVIWCDWVYVELGHIEISNLSIWRAAWMGGVGVLVIKVGKGCVVCSRGEMAVIRHICELSVIVATFSPLFSVFALLLVLTSVIATIVIVVVILLVWFAPLLHQASLSSSTKHFLLWRIVWCILAFFILECRCVMIQLHRFCWTCRVIAVCKAILVVIWCWRPHHGLLLMLIRLLVVTIIVDIRLLDLHLWIAVLSIVKLVLLGCPHLDLCATCGRLWLLTNTCCILRFHLRTKMHVHMHQFKRVINNN